MFLWLKHSDVACPSLHWNSSHGTLLGDRSAPLCSDQGTSSILYYTSFIRVHQFTLNAVSFIPSLNFVQEHSRYKVSVELEHSRARTEPQVHITWPHLTPHHHCLLWGATHARE